MMLPSSLDSTTNLCPPTTMSPCVRSLVARLETMSCSRRFSADRVLPAFRRDVLPATYYLPRFKAHLVQVFCRCTHVSMFPCGRGASASKTSRPLFLGEELARWWVSLPTSLHPHAFEQTHTWRKQRRSHLFALEEPRPVARLVRLDREGVALGQHLPRVRQDGGLHESDRKKNKKNRSPAVGNERTVHVAQSTGRPRGERRCQHPVTRERLGRRNGRHGRT